MFYVGYRIVFILYAVVSVLVGVVGLFEFIHASPYWFSKGMAYGILYLSAAVMAFLIGTHLVIVGISWAWEGILDRIR